MPSLPTEEIELAADESPNGYDFLGKGIDYGFRIGSNSRPDFFTLSPALAQILCIANTNQILGKPEFDLNFEGTGVLKGVLNEEKYPKIGLNTERKIDRRELNYHEMELSGHGKTDASKLDAYLGKFIAFHGVEKPILKIKPSDDHPEKPPYYLAFLEEWNRDVQDSESSDARFDESAAKEGKGEEISAEEIDEIVRQLNGD